MRCKADEQIGTAHAPCAATPSQPFVAAGTSPSAPRSAGAPPASLSAAFAPPTAVQCRLPSSRPSASAAQPYHHKRPRSAPSLPPAPEQQALWPRRQRRRCSPRQALQLRTRAQRTARVRRLLSQHRSAHAASWSQCPPDAAAALHVCRRRLSPAVAPPRAHAECAGDQAQLAPAACMPQRFPEPQPLLRASCGLCAALARHRLRALRCCWRGLRCWPRCALGGVHQQPVN